MKIAVIGNATRSLNDPLKREVERFANGLSKHLAATGHKVVLYSNGPLRPGAAVSKRPIHKNAEQMAREINGKGFDLVHNNCLDPAFLFAATIISAPTITTLRSPPLQGHLQALQQSRGTCSYFVAANRAIQKIWRRKAPGLAMPAIHSVCADPGEEVCLSFDGPGTSALWTGVIGPKSGLDLAIQACHLSGVPLKICGPVADREYFRKQALPLLGNNDQYLGDLDMPGLKEEMQTCAAGIVTDCPESAVPLAALEMLFAGLPLAAFAKGGVQELITPNNGRLARPGDVRALTKCLAETKTLCKVRIQQEAVNKRSLSRIGTKYERIFNFIRSRHEYLLGRKTHWHLHSR